MLTSGPRQPHCSCRVVLSLNMAAHSVKLILIATRTLRNATAKMCASAVCWNSERTSAFVAMQCARRDGGRTTPGILNVTTLSEVHQSIALLADLQASLRWMRCLSLVLDHHLLPSANHDDGKNKLELFILPATKQVMFDGVLLSLDRNFGPVIPIRRS